MRSDGGGYLSGVFTDPVFWFRGVEVGNLGLVELEAMVRLVDLKRPEIF